MTIEDVRTWLGGTAASVDELVPGQPPRQPDADDAATCPDVRGLRVLVVGINFGPEHTGIAPYTTQLCEYLEAQGASVSVFTGTPHYPSWTVDPTMRWRMRRIERRDRFELRRLRHYVPKKQSALRRALYELTFALQVALQRPKERPDVVLAVVPSLLSAVAAQRIAKRAGVPLVVWVQDLMGPAASQSGIEGGDRVAGLVGSVEKWVLQHARQVLVLNNHFRTYVESLGIDSKNLRVHPNWSHIVPPSTIDRSIWRERLHWGLDELIVLHTGNMGLKQGLESVIEAARLASEDIDNKIKFVLMGDGNQRWRLQERARGVPAISFLAPAPEGDYANILAAADVLLVNERRTSTDMSLPSKLTSYLLSGRPIVAACASKGGTATEIDRSGSGLVVPPEHPLALLSGVKALAACDTSMKNMADAGKLYAEKNLRTDRALIAMRKMLIDAAVGIPFASALPIEP